MDQIFLGDKAFYVSNNVDLALGTAAVELNASQKTVKTDNGESIKYTKLLLATGDTRGPGHTGRHAPPEICYFRTLDDYRNVRRLASSESKAVIIGGGFIGSEIAAALNVNKVGVTMIFPEEYLVQRIFPRDLGNAIQKHYTERGITILNNDVPVSFEKKSGTDRDPLRKAAASLNPTS